MYAIVEISGKQYKVQENDKLIVPHLKDAKVDDTIDFDRVLLVADDGDVKVGTPLVANATMSAKVLEHVKADKVLVFRKIRRKRFKVMKGHRQRYTRIEVSDLSVNGEGKKSKSKKSTEAAEAKSTEAAEAKSTEAAEVKPTEAAAPKKAEASKPKKAEVPEVQKTEAAEAKKPKAADVKEAAESTTKAEEPEVKKAEAAAAVEPEAKKAEATKTKAQKAAEAASPEADAGPKPADTDESEESGDKK